MANYSMNYNIRISTVRKKRLDELAKRTNLSSSDIARHAIGIIMNLAEEVSLEQFQYEVTAGAAYEKCDQLCPKNKRPEGLVKDFQTMKYLLAAKKLNAENEKTYRKTLENIDALIESK